MQPNCPFRIQAAFLVMELARASSENSGRPDLATNLVGHSKSGPGCMCIRESGRATSVNNEKPWPGVVSKG